MLVAVYKFRWTEYINVLCWPAILNNYNFPRGVHITYTTVIVVLKELIPQIKLKHTDDLFKLLSAFIFPFNLCARCVPLFFKIKVPLKLQHVSLPKYRIHHFKKNLFSLYLSSYILLSQMHTQRLLCH